MPPARQEKGSAALALLVESLQEVLPREEGCCRPILQLLVRLRI